MKQTYPYIVLILFVLVAFALPGYFGYSYYMKQSELNGVERKLDSAQKTLARLQKEEKAINVADSQRLQTRVPTDLALDTVVDSLSHASQLADVRITSVTFGDEKKQDEANQPSEQEDGDQSSENSTENTVSATEEGPTEVAGARSFRSEVTLEADSYRDLLTFLESIEATSRIQVLRTITFAGPEEPGPNAKDEPEKLTFTVELDAFYRQDLDRLKEDRYVPKPTFPRKEIPVYDYTSAD